MVYNEKKVYEVLKMILYFSKINLESVRLLEMYKKEELLVEMKKAIVSFLETGIIYEVEGSYIDEDGERHIFTTKYRISLGVKKEDYISGYIYKTTVIYYKAINEKTSRIESRSQPTIEDIKFYYDVNREVVGFHTRNRFGHKEFNQAFKGILNNCMEQSGVSLRFDVNLYNEGLEIEEIESELKRINNIKKLEFKYKLPNPSDEYMLHELEEKLTDVAEDLEKANANSMSVIFDSDGGTGLNIESPEIKKNFSRVGVLSRGINAMKAIKNGYVRVKATGKDGKIYTTEEQKPVKREISDDSGDGFFKACRETISHLF